MKFQASVGRRGRHAVSVGLALLVMFLAVPALAQQNIPQPDEAFKPTAEAVGPDKVRISWEIHEDTYLYRDKLGLSLVRPEGGAVAGQELPPGKKKYDEVFGKELRVFRDKATLTAELETLDGAREVTLEARYQGCADAGVCYPPQTKQLTVALPAASAGTGSSGGAATAAATSGARDLLPPEKAFKPSVTATGTDQVKAAWEVADGYYLYRDKLDLRVVKPEGLKVAGRELPPGKKKYDEVFDKELRIFRKEAALTANLARDGSGAQPVTVELRYQGCADAGVCYPPQTKQAALTLPAAGTAEAAAAGGDGGSGGPPASEQGQFAAALESGGILALGFFFLAGLGLAFTPCIFPMVPILSGIIVGAGGSEGAPGMTKARAFTLSLAYVLGVAITYAILGVIAGATGAAIQAALQNPWVIGAFAAVFVALALSMFGFYDLQLPSSLQTRIQQSQENLGRGSVTGTLVMGVLSALIVGPCVAPPLAGALLYIGQTGDMVLGGTSLFAMSLGMGVPLLVVGTTAGSVMPRAGTWMNAVKYVFGVLLLGVAIFLVSRIIPYAVSLFLWGLLLVVAAVYLGALDRLAPEASGWQRLWKGLGVVLLVLGTLELVGAVTGGEDPLDPLEGLVAAGGSVAAGGESGEEGLEFRRVQSMEELQAALDEAAAAGRPVMLDFYADWCIECVRYERSTFESPQVHEVLKGQDALLLQADVTQQNAADKALQRHFNIIGPPAIMFFDRDGQEIQSARIAGYKGAEEFVKHVRQVYGS
ncbi:protein-disulfide reductase DsbD [Thiohalorhabdus sp. Cl-TMA]|uniref:Thiol:disulfide interchange protein DsbD n=1 Tax=Thiohalorhabdus methylotrophus TaxID=3242694 RepID=A0ABV4TU49_9GAMM